MRFSEALPSEYARDRLARLRGRWDRWRDIFHHAGRIAWAGLPTPAVVAMTANSVDERESYTAGGLTAIGLFQTPVQTWDRLRTDARVRRILGGRNAIERAAGWQSAPHDQIAIGVVDYANAASDVARALRVDVRPTNTASQWAYACGVAGYVVGAGAAARILERLAQPVGDVHAFSVVLAAAAAGELDRQAAHALVRTWQRLACGEVLYRAVGDFAGFPLGHGIELGSLDWASERSRAGTPGFRGGWPTNLGSTSWTAPLSPAAPIVPPNDADAAWWALTVPQGAAERITAAYYPDGAPAWALAPLVYGPSITTAPASTSSTGGRLALALGAGALAGWAYLRRRRR